METPRPSTIPKSGSRNSNPRIDAYVKCGATSVNGKANGKCCYALTLNQGHWDLKYLLKGGRVENEIRPTFHLIISIAWQRSSNNYHWMTIGSWLRLNRIPILCFAVDAYWDSWQEWNDCSKSCGNGSQSRTRECILGKYGGSNCTGQYLESQNCNTQPCPGTSCIEFYKSLIGNIQRRTERVVGPIYTLHINA